MKRTLTIAECQLCFETKEVHNHHVKWENMEIPTSPINYEHLEHLCPSCHRIIEPPGGQPHGQEELVAEISVWLPEKGVPSDRDKQRLRDTAYRAANPEIFREYARRCMAKWRAANPEIARERVRKSTAKRRAADPKAYQEYQREWKKNNPEAVREHQRKYREANRDAINECARAKYSAERDKPRKG